MAAIAEKRYHRLNPTEEIELWARRHTQQWCEMCDEFKTVTRQTILARQRWQIGGVFVWRE